MSVSFIFWQLFKTVKFAYWSFLICRLLDAWRIQFQKHEISIPRNWKWKNGTGLVIYTVYVCLYSRTYTNIGSLGQHVLSVGADNQLMLTYENGDKCSDQKLYKTVIKLMCDEQVNNSLCLLYCNLTSFPISIVIQATLEMLGSDMQ